MKVFSLIIFSMQLIGKNILLTGFILTGFLVVHATLLCPENKFLNYDMMLCTVDDI